jgi:DNA mismatch endonuclease (patch repair protein)
MQAIKSKNTRPELLVRRVLHRMGYRYRVHARDLPGKPDIAFRRRKKVIFVHGCFWHSHTEPGCRNALKPKTNAGYWTDKLTKTRARDEAALRALEQAGWHALVIWECELHHENELATRLNDFLRDAEP